MTWNPAVKIFAVKKNQIKSKIRAHDDSELPYSNRAKHHGGDYGSRSDSYSTPHQEMYNSAFGYSTNQNSVPQELHERL
jgi:hypothetical protein